MAIPFYYNPATNELELTADPSPLRDSLGTRFRLNEISIARNTLSPTKSYTEDRIDMKPGGIVEPGVMNYGDTVQPMSTELAEWYEKNKGKILRDAKGNLKPARVWEDLEISERLSVKSQFAKRNRPFYVNLRELETFKDFLQKQKDAGRTVFRMTLPEIAKEAGLTLKSTQVANIINNYFPDTFNYKGLDLDQAPGILKRVKELAKTNTISQITNMLYDEGLLVSKDPSSVYRLAKDNKILIKAPTQDIDDLVKTYVQNNPKITDINQIAENLSDQVGKKIHPTTVRLAAKRQNIKNLTSLQDVILKEIKALDNIVKNNLNIINDPNMKPTAKNRILQQHYLKATGKKFADLAVEEFGSRLSRLAKLYAGKGRIKIFKNIEAPLNYLDLSNSLQKNIIEMASKAKQLSNYAMGEMLGLPANQLKLISDTAGMMKAFDFSVAGDHTDIKSMMKDFPKYKENFSRIEYIKNNLNLYKKKYDLQINALRKKAQEANYPVTKQKFLDDAKILQEKFAKITGYRIGTFDIKNNRVVINPQTARLPDLKNPLNTALQTAIRNFAETESPKTGQIGAATKEILTAVDKKFSDIKTGVQERIEIFKKIQGTNAAKNSKYLQALSKIPGKHGQAAKAIILGTASALTIATLASAGTTLEKGITTKEMKERKEGTLKPGDKTQEDRTAVFPYDIVSAIAKDPQTAAVLGGTTIAGAAISKPTKAVEIAKKAPTKVLSAFEKIIRPLFVPIVDVGAALVDTPITDKEHHRDVTSPGFWMTKAFWASAMDSYGITKTYSMLKNTPDFKGKAKIARDIFLRAGINPAAVRFISSKIAWPATAAASVYDAYKDYKRTDAAIKKRWEEDPEGMKKQAMEDAEIVKGDTSEMFAMGGIASLMK